MEKHRNEPNASALLAIGKRRLPSTNLGWLDDSLTATLTLERFSKCTRMTPLLYEAGRYINLDVPTNYIFSAVISFTLF